MKALKQVCRSIFLRAAREQDRKINMLFRDLAEFGRNCRNGHHKLGGLSGSNFESEVVDIARHFRFGGPFLTSSTSFAKLSRKSFSMSSADPWPAR